MSDLQAAIVDVLVYIARVYLRLEGAKSSVKSEAPAELSRRETVLCGQEHY